MTYKGFLILPTKIGYLVRKALDIGVVDHYAMKKLEWCDLDTIHLEGLTKEQFILLTSQQTPVHFSYTRMTDLDTNLLITEVTIPSIGYKKMKTLAPILPMQETKIPFLGKPLEGLDTLTVAPHDVVLSKA